MSQRVFAVACLLAVGVCLCGCGSGGWTGEGPPAPGRTMMVGSLRVNVAAAAGFRATPLTSPGRVAFTVLHGSRIQRLEQMGYGRIVFSRKVFPSSSLWDLWLMNSDGAGQMQLTDDAGYELDPSWSPDGSRIAFAKTPEPGDSEIHVINANGTSEQPVTSDTYDDYHPAWSPDGTRIAFVKLATDAEVYVAEPDGSGVQNLTNNTTGDSDPGWSPDGSRIVYVHTGAGDDPELWVMNADGSAKEPLTDNTVRDGWPAWSPDGSKIAWTQYVSIDLEDIYVMNADGTGVRKLTRNPDTDMRPAWSPDGREIVYQSERGSNPEIFAMSADGTSPANLSRSKEEDERPDWCPAPSAVRTLIGPAGSDGGSSPPFDAARPLVVVGTTPDGLASAATINLPVTSWPGIAVQPLDNLSTLLAGVKVTAGRLTGVVEDLGRGLAARTWKLAGTPAAGAVLIYFTADTGRIASVIASGDTALSTSAGEATAEAGCITVRGPIAAAYDARDPSRNLAEAPAREVVLDGRTGHVVQVR